MRHAWFWNHVWGLSLWMVARCGSLGTWFPQNSTSPDFYSSSSDPGDGFTHAASISHSPVSSPRSGLHGHSSTAGNMDTTEMQTISERSSKALESTSQTPDRLASSVSSSTTEPVYSSSIQSSSTHRSTHSSTHSSTHGSTRSSSQDSSTRSSSQDSSSQDSSSQDSSSQGSSTQGSSTQGSSTQGSSTQGSSTQGSSTQGSTHSSTQISSTHSSTQDSSPQDSSTHSTPQDHTTQDHSTQDHSTQDHSTQDHSTQGSDGTSHSTHRHQAPMGSPSVSQEFWTWTETEDSSLLGDSPDSTLRLGDVTNISAQTYFNTDSDYTSTTMSRAGERTLLSVTVLQNNFSSPLFTQDSTSNEPSATWALSLQTVEDYTRTISVPKTEIMDTRQKQTDVYRETYSESVLSSGTETLTNSTDDQQAFTAHVTSNLTRSSEVTDPSLSQTESFVSSTPPMLSPAILPKHVSPDAEVSPYYETSTEKSTQSLITQNQEGTERVPSRTEEDALDLHTEALTTAAPTLSSWTPDCLTKTPPLVITEVFPTTTAATVTARPQLQTEASSPAAVSTTSLPLSDSPTSKSTLIKSTAAASQTTVSHSSVSAETFTPKLETTTAFPEFVPSLTAKTSTSAPTKATTLQLRTSARPLEVTTASSKGTTTVTTTNRTPAPSSETETSSPAVTTLSTAVQPPPSHPRNPCLSNPCLNSGMCVSFEGHHFTCRCQQAWTGPTCGEDVNECERDPCPLGSRCENTRGSFSCECPLGFNLEDGRTCSRAKTFLGIFSVNKQIHDPVVFKSAQMHEIQREIIHLLNASLSVLRGYSRSTLRKREEGRTGILAVNMFSISADVTSSEVYNSIHATLTNCSFFLSHCRMVLQHQISYQVESLCEAQKTQCDTERSVCTDHSGTASCQCLPGYYKHNPEDLSCLECGDGYKLENGTCQPCMFGFGGFNCGNFYKLIAVVVSPAGGGILLILIIVLIVTCFKRDNNDINKIIFKSGDLQMSPYADFPKANRISMEWGRETIEMQENGSTKNLLQMTDIYYSPALRNADLERNGLYPFTGLPGSRHSCIYPAQFNPSFISDDSRRRDYF
ncbi:unnamed protein product [Knipowitschia caucasica]